MLTNHFLASRAGAVSVVRGVPWSGTLRTKAESDILIRLFSYEPNRPFCSVLAVTCSGLRSPHETSRTYRIPAIGVASFDDPIRHHVLVCIRYSAVRSTEVLLFRLERSVRILRDADSVDRSLVSNSTRTRCTSTVLVNSVVIFHCWFRLLSLFYDNYIRVRVVHQRKI
jgi:hypothetical protein